MEQDSESYVGAFISPFLGRGRWVNAGYGVYVTTRRVIGFRSWKVRTIFFIGPSLGAMGVLLRLLEGFVLQSGSISQITLLSVEVVLVITGSVVFVLLAIFFPIVPVERGPEFLRNLGIKRDFEVSKVEIHQIILGRGSLTIETKTGRTIRIGIGHKTVFKRTSEIMRIFHPEVLKLV